MRIHKWIVLLACSFLVLSTSCKPKVGGKCTIGQSYCTKDGALFCGEDGKLVATSCQGPLGCVQHGKAASCDQSLAVVGEPCEDQDNVACSVDKRSELDCKAKLWTLGATCKGAKGCELKGEELFCDHTLADNPYGESFISATASSSLDTFTIPTTGPNDSSRITLIEWSTSISTVGPR